MRRVQSSRRGRWLAGAVAAILGGATALWFPLLDRREVPSCSAAIEVSTVTAGSQSEASPRAAAAATDRAIATRVTDDVWIARADTAASSSAPAGDTLDYVAHAAKFGIEREPWPEIEGTVVRDEDGTPVAGAIVEVCWFSKSTTVAPGDRPEERLRLAGSVSGSTDAAGRFRVRTGSEIEITAHAPGLGFEAALVDEKKAALAQPLQFRLRRVLEFSGRVVDAEGLPVPNAHVDAIGLQKTGAFRLWGYCGNPLTAWRFDLANTDCDGNFPTVECYADERVTLVVTKADRCVHFPTISLGTADVPARTVELKMPPSCSIEGFVRRGDGTPSSHVCISLARQFDAWSPLYSGCSVHDDGHYRDELEVSGTYHVGLIGADEGGHPIQIAAVDQYLGPGVTRVDWIDPRPRSATAIATDASDGDGDGDETEEKGNVAGAIACASADEHATARVLLLRRGRVDDDVDVQGNGRLTFEFDRVSLGTYTVTALVEGCRRIESAPFVVESGRHTQLPTLTPEPFGSIRGRVVDPRGRGVGDAGVVLEVKFENVHVPRRPLYECIAGMQSNADGDFSLPATDGEAVIHVEAPGRPPVVVPVAVTNTTTAPEIVVPVGALRMVHGKVVVPGGIPGTRLTVACWSVVPPERRDRSTGALDPMEKLGEIDVSADGTFDALAIPTTDCDLVLWFNSSAWDNEGFDVARRHVAAGEADLDLGDWVLQAAPH